MAVSMGLSVASIAASRHSALWTQQLSGQHLRKPQKCIVYTDKSLWRQNTSVGCRSNPEERPSADEQDRQDFSLSASSSGDEGAEVSQICNVCFLKGSSVST